jgi:serine/threonine-protein kinase
MSRARGDIIPTVAPDAGGLPMSPDIDRNLLFGLLALQNGLIDQVQLVAAFQAWTRDRARSLADHLVDRDDLDAEQRGAVEAMVALHLKKHGGDHEKSLGALGVGASTRQALAEVGDLGLRSVLTRVGSGVADKDDDADRTRSYAVGTTTSQGQRFRVLRPHAKGGLGAVFVAVDSELNREVALKQILDGHADDPVSRQRFLLEAEVTGGLEHPGIVPVYGLGTYGDGRPYYAMRFIRGDSLKEAIARFRADEGLKHDPGARSLALRKLLRRFLDVCNAIDYAHGRGVLHRDIKPGNVIVGKHGETLVIDWGLAKATGQSEGVEPSEERSLSPSSASGSAETLPGAALGTPAYMSPEQARGDLEALGPRSDVYSLGATLYCLLTGRPPFEGPDVGALLRAVQAGDFPPPRRLDPTIDKSLEAVCLKAMAREPADRYPSARALADDVERWIADEPVSARREPASARLGRWARRHRTAVSALGLSMATAVILLTILVILVGSAQRATSRALVRVKQEQGRTAEALSRADANFRRARQAVDDYFTTVSEDVLLDEPGMQPLRAKLLRTALDYHAAFLHERAGDPAVEAELAESHRRYALIAAITGRRGEAEPHLRTALAMFEGLARRYPDRPEHRREIARLLCALSQHIAGEDGGLDRGIRLLRESIDAYDRLLRERFDDASTLDGLAIALAELGLIRTNQIGGAEEARALLRRARDILRRLAAEQPDSLRYRFRLAELHSRLYGRLVGDARWQAEATQSSQDAITLLQELIRRVPNSPRFRDQLGSVRRSRGNQHFRMRRYADAAGEYREARRIMTDLVRANPDNETYRMNLALTCSDLGSALRNAGASEEALGPLREACDACDRYLTSHPEDLAYRKEYIETLGELGAALVSLRRHDEGSAALRRSVDLAAEYCKHDPTDIFLRGDMMIFLGNLGSTLTRAGRHRDAVAEYERSRAISREIFGGTGWSHGVGMAGLQVSLATSLREIGRPDEAEALVAEARRELGDDPGNYWQLAGYEARGAALLAQAGGDPAAVKALKDRAMASLRRAVDLGFTELADIRDVAWFDSLRDREDFRLLMLGLAFPADPFARRD